MAAACLGPPDDLSHINRPSGAPHDQNDQHQRPRTSISTKAFGKLPPRGISGLYVKAAASAAKAAGVYVCKDRVSSAGPHKKGPFTPGRSNMGTRSCVQTSCCLLHGVSPSFGGAHITPQVKRQPSVLARCLLSYNSVAVSSVHAVSADTACPFTRCQPPHCNVGIFKSK